MRRADLADAAEDDAAFVATAVPHGCRRYSAPEPP